MERRFATSLAITALPLLPILIFYQRLPAKIAIQWGTQGEATNVVPKLFGTFGILLVFVLLHIYFYKWRFPRTGSLLYVWLMPILSNICLLFVLEAGLAQKLTTVALASQIHLFAGLLLVAIGIIITVNRYNPVTFRHNHFLTIRQSNWIGGAYQLVGFLLIIFTVNAWISLLLLLALLAMARILPHFVKN